MCTWSEIASDMAFLENVPFGRAIGFNANSSEKRAKFYDSTMKDYLHYLWNNPRAGQSPFKMFGGVMAPNGFDDNGDVIYTYDPTKTFMTGFTGCTGCTEHGFFDVLE